MDISTPFSEVSFDPGLFQAGTIGGALMHRLDGV